MKYKIGERLKHINRASLEEYYIKDYHVYSSMYCVLPTYAKHSNVFDWYSEKELNISFYKLDVKQTTNNYLKVELV